MGLRRDLKIGKALSTPLAEFQVAWERRDLDALKTSAGELDRVLRWAITELGGAVHLGSTFASADARKVAGFQDLRLACSLALLGTLPDPVSGRTSMSAADFDECGRLIQRGLQTAYPG